MAAFLPNGSTLSIAKPNTAVVMSALTNAAEAVATAAGGHGIVGGEAIVLTSGWSRVNGRAYRAKTVATNDITVENLNSTSTALYPSGGGTGYIARVPANGYTQLSQIMDSRTSGGDQQFENYGFLEDQDDRELPTSRTPMRLALDLADDPSLPWVAILQAADEDRAVRVLKLTLSTGAIILYCGTMTFNPTPTLNRNRVMVVTASFSLQGRPVRYAS